MGTKVSSALAFVLASFMMSNLYTAITALFLAYGGLQDIRIAAFGAVLSLEDNGSCDQLHVREHLGKVILEMVDQHGQLDAKSIGQPILVQVYGLEHRSEDFINYHIFVRHFKLIIEHLLEIFFSLSTEVNVEDSITTITHLTITGPRIS